MTVDDDDHNKIQYHFCDSECRQLSEPFLVTVVLSTLPLDVPGGCLRCGN